MKVNGQLICRNMILLVSIILYCQSSWAVASDTVRIGVLAHRGKPQAIVRWAPTAEYLSVTTGHRFEILPLNLDETSDAIVNNDIQFILTNPGNYADLATRFGVSRIATMQTIDNGKIHIRYGAVIISRADNSAINSLKDLKGKSFMAVSPEAFGGFQMAWREFLDHKINPFTDFSQIKFVGFPQDKIIDAVIEGRVDAATVRSDTLVKVIESGKYDQAAFNILNPQGDTHYPLSTRLYPEWPIATLKDTSRTLATQVAQALLAMPKEHAAAVTSGLSGWTVPLDYSAVNELMRSLQIGPYEVLRETSFWAVVKRNSVWFIAVGIGIFCLILLNGYISRTNRRLKETEHILREEIEQRQRSQEALARYKDTLEEKVQERTEDLRTTNLALEKSRVALRRLVAITSAPDLSHDEKLVSLLDTGRDYYDLPVAVLAGTESMLGGLYKTSGDTQLIPQQSGPLNERCVTQILEQKGEPLDIPDLRTVLGEDSKCLQYGWNSYLGTTVLVDGMIYCTLEFVGTKMRHNHLSKWDLDILKVMAQWIGDELERQIAHDAQHTHQSELARVSRMSTVGEMAASLAHELNQPLTGAINYSSACLRMLRQGEQDIEKITQGIERSVEGATLAADIIRHIREFVQKGDASRQDVDINNMVNNVVSLMKYEAGRHQVMIDLDLQENLSAIEGNMIQLEQVVLNLMKNAIDAMENVAPDERCLTIRTQQNRQLTEIKVSDTGEGISEQHLRKIFDAFYSTKPEGMGIGLSISRSIIESHHGCIKARNLATQGAEFSVEIPVILAS